MTTLLLFFALFLSKINAFVGVNWTLLAHGSDRFSFDSSSSDYKSWTVSSTDTFHFINWQSPFDDAIQPIQAGAVMHRPSDGMIHVMLAGNNKVNLGSEMPGGGSLKAYGPPLIWEIDPKTGSTNYLYNLSDYGLAFYSSLRYTPNGDLTVAVCKANSPSNIKILIIDQTSHEIKFQHTPSIEPMLLQLTNTEPQMLLYAGMSDDAYLNFTDDGTMIAANDKEVVNGYISAIIFGADGQTIYNNGFMNEATGVYRFKLPFSSTSRPEDFIPSCDTLPWAMASDTEGSMFTSCDQYNDQYTITKYDVNGKSVWSSKVTQINPYSYPWIILDDTEKYVITGNNVNWTVFDAETGDLKWAKSVSDIMQKRESNLVCYDSAQPWANRHPVIMPDGKLIILCQEKGVGYSIRGLDVETGNLARDVENVAFNVSMLSADSTSVYLWGYKDLDKHISGQRIPM